MPGAGIPPPPPRPRGSAGDDRLVDNVQLENPLPQVWQPGDWDLAQSHERAAEDLTLFLGLLDARPGMPLCRARSNHALLDISGTGAWTSVSIV